MQTLFHCFCREAQENGEYAEAFWLCAQCTQSMEELGDGLKVAQEVRVGMSYAVWNGNECDADSSKASQLVVLMPADSFGPPQCCSQHWSHKPSPLPTRSWQPPSGGCIRRPLAGWTARWRPLPPTSGPPTTPR